MNRVLVTGSSGFIGRALIDELLARGHQVRLAQRSPTTRNRVTGTEVVIVGSLSEHTDWTEALQGASAVVHLAALAHVMRGADPEAFHRANFRATQALANACRGKVERFVFLSSIAVHGSVGHMHPVNADSAMAPDTPYGESKALADEFVRKLASQGDLPAVVLRPPLVYGPQAPGNFQRLASLVRRGVPLPLASVRNRRSLLGRDHLVRAIAALLEQELPARSAYCLADREVLSTPDIIRQLATALGRPARLIPFPTNALQLLARLSGQQRTVEQLIGSLEVDARDFRGDVGDFQYRPTSEGLQEMLTYAR